MLARNYKKKRMGKKKENNNKQNKNKSKLFDVLCSLFLFLFF